MARMLVVPLALLVAAVSAYHDPDLNYHLNKLQDCETPGYHYPAPSAPLQLTPGIKYPAPVAPAYNSYLPPVPPQNSYLPPVPPPNSYLPPVPPPNSYLPPVPPTASYLPPTGSYLPPYQANYAHTSYGTPANSFFSHPARQPPPQVTGWPTGVDQYNFPPSRTALPLAVYNKAPILGKITAAPLFTKYAAPQNHLGFPYAKSLNTFGTETGAAVVTHAYGNPTRVYATAQGLLPPLAPSTPAPLVQLWPSPTPPPLQPAAPLPALPQPLPPALPAVTYHGAPKPLAHAKNVHTDFVENYDANPQYSYSYGVHDAHTGDIKQQSETRDGEVVRGQYSLVEPDGSVRTVDYVADWDTGFHASVRNSKDRQH